MYEPQALRKAWIGKAEGGEKRPIGVPTVRDRIVQTALRNVMEPIFEREFTDHSYGFRPERSCKDALRRVEELRKASRCVVHVEMKDCFNSIPHDGLLRRVRDKVTDGRVLCMIDRFLKQGVMEGMQQWTPEEGRPQGAVIGPLLSNIYLNPLDQAVTERRFQIVTIFAIIFRKLSESRCISISFFSFANGDPYPW